MSENPESANPAVAPTDTLARLARGCNSFAGFLLLAMMTLTVADVLLRKFLGTGVLGGLELSEFLLVGVAFCALAQAEQEEHHIRLNWLGRFGRNRGGQVLVAIAHLLGAALVAAISLSTLSHALAIRSAAEVSTDLGIPRYPMILVASLGCALFALLILSRCKSILTQGRRL
ncbi:MAG: TRAP transporter small permease [Syntrophaceae bacterium]|nr:TRAP transporter small permease [Syntrophaceae bacterium]